MTPKVTTAVGVGKYRRRHGQVSCRCDGDDSLPPTARWGYNKPAMARQGGGREKNVSIHATRYIIVTQPGGYKRTRRVSLTHSTRKTL